MPVATTVRLRRFIRIIFHNFNSISSFHLFFFSSAGLVSKFFSAKIFVRINKLTYAIYLLNPLVISIVFGKIDNGTFVDPMLYSILIIGITLSTYVLAIAFSLLFEIPFYKLSNEILRGSSIAITKPTKIKSN